MFPGGQDNIYYPLSPQDTQTNDLYIAQVQYVFFFLFNVPEPQVGMCTHKCSYWCHYKSDWYPLRHLWVSKVYAKMNRLWEYLGTESRKGSSFHLLTQTQMLLLFTEGPAICLALHSSQGKALSLPSGVWRTRLVRHKRQVKTGKNEKQSKPVA